MESPLILVIDDSQTIRKLVECHLSQAGYRVAMAADADYGIELAGTIGPNLILLDHQLLGTTGDEVCRRLLQSEVTARIPVVVSSAMRNRAFAQYTEFSNVVDQIPKPFTPELLKSGVANALQLGEMVVQAQRTGCAVPDTVGELQEFALEGNTAVFPLRAVLDLLNNNAQGGRLTLETGKDRIRFALAGGRIQAVFSPTISADRLEPFLPADLGDLAPLLAMTLGEHQDASMASLVRLLERSLSDPRRLRSLLKLQSAVLAYWALTGEPGKFTFEANAALPPMFQAFPLQVSLPALAVEGLGRSEPAADEAVWGPLIFARQNPRGGNLDRAGLSHAAMKVHSLFDGTQPLAAIAEAVGLGVADVAGVARGLELTGLVERRTPSSHASILVLEDDPETVRTVQRILGADGDDYGIKVVRDRVGAQLLLRRQPFDLVMMALDRADQEAFYRTAKESSSSSTRFVGILGLDDESQLARLDAMGLDGILHRPVTEADVRATVKHLLFSEGLAAVA